ncbi:MAG: NUDIX domain-containing protein [Acholeplasmataceae bacterium]|nr:NUDIX domain-containing protein [Acholeplasmataceae bacterium]
MLFEKSCGAVVYKKENNDYFFLVIRQRHGLHYGFPKGHVERNELEEVTAKREVEEETGVNVRIIKDIRAESNYTPRPNVQKKVVYFLAESLTQNIHKQDAEILSVDWVHEELVYEMLTHENDRAVYHLMLKKLKQTDNNE